MKLEDIGFYTLTDDRAKNASMNSPIWRAELIITKKCNFNCHYCRKVGSEMSPEEVERNVNLLKNMGLKNIRFSGGEPTLVMDSLTTGITSSKGCDHIAISTNGSSDWEVYERLIELGVNDFSISLDACCASDGDEISKCEGSWEKVVDNIKNIVKSGIYITLGIVVLPETQDKLTEVISFAQNLGVSDIRPIPAAQWVNKIDLPNIEEFPILNYRSKNSVFRGNPFPKCGLVLDDLAMMGDYHYPCVIYLREGGKPIGKINENIRKDRQNWYTTHNCQNDPICKNQCLDVCVEYNKRFSEFHKI